MFHGLITNSERGWRRRTCVGVMIVAYLTAAIGYPLPEGRSESANSCGAGVCGCGTAEQCKASGCGCSHSKAEPKPTPPPASCCAKKPTKPAKSSCCSSPKPDAKPEAASPERKGDSNASSLRWVVGISALKCKGLATTWISVGAALPLTEIVHWQPNWIYVGDLPIIHRHAPYHSKVPLDPPPRLSIS